MATTPSSAVPIPTSTYTEESPTPTKGATPCLSTMVRAMQMGCLVLIPIFAVSLIFFLSVFAIKCDCSGGFVINQSGEVNCVSSARDIAMSGRETQQAASSTDNSSGNGRVVMTVTRVVLISVSALIVSFTAWICIWYQLYGKTDAAGSAPVEASGSDGQVPLETVLTVRVDKFLAKEDMERLLGPDHSAAPAV